MSADATKTATIEAFPTRRWLSLSGPTLGLACVFGLFVVLIGLKGELGNFLSPGNLKVLIHEGTIPAVLALGMLLVIISGGIDLSVGAVVALVTVVTMKVYILAHGAFGMGAMTSLIAVGSGILTGGLCGLANGLLVTKLRLPSFVVTLGMLSVARGTAIFLAERTQIAFPLNARPEWVNTFARSTIENPGFISLILLACLFTIVLRATIFGRHLYAVGSSEATARLCGVSVDRVRITVFTLNGLLAGWAGVLMFAHGDSGNPTAGEGLELQVIAAVVIGGAALTGGRGTVIGALIGVLILGLLANGVSLFNVPVEMQNILIGVIILANAALSQWQRARKP